MAVPPFTSLVADTTLWCLIAFAGVDDHFLPLVFLIFDDKRGAVSLD